MTLLEPRPPALDAAPVPVCAVERLQVGRGVAALVDGRAVALFRLDPALLDGRDHGVRAVDDVDPHSGASVLSRGLVGSTMHRGDLVHYVASPLRKQRFDLATGSGLDGGPALSTWAVDVVDGVVLVTPGPTSSSGNDRETKP